MTESPRQPSDSATPRTPGRLARWYRTTGVVLLSATLLTVVLVATLHLLYPLERSFWHQNLAGRRLSETLVAEHYYLSGAEETDEIRRNWDEYVLAGHWQVHPWTGLVNREFSSRHLNVDRRGRRATLDPSDEHAGLQPLEIWAFGSSTLFGWGLSDRRTIPSQLQAALQRRLPNRQVGVTNFGVPWYNSSHEVALLTASLREAARPPAIVVFLDGTADLIHSVHYHSESPLNRQLEGAWEERLGTAFAPPPWVRLAPSFPPLRVARALSGQAQPTLGGLPAPAGTKPERQWIEEAANRYAMNHRFASLLAEDLGVAPYFFLEPAARWLNETRNATIDPRFEAYYGILLGDGGESIHDLRAVLASLSPERSMTVEDTGTHFSDAAAQTVAEAMAATIEAGLAASRGLVEERLALRPGGEESDQYQGQGVEDD